MSVTLGAIVALNFDYKEADGDKERAIAKYEKICTDAAKLISVKTLRYILPYSKDELRQALEEDPLLNNLDWELIWQNIMDGIRDPQAPEIAALFDWRRKDFGYTSSEEERDKTIAKYKTMPVLKQAIRLYVNIPD